MHYFNERHNLNVEYSGYEELSSELRSRLIQVYGHHTRAAASGQGFCVPSRELEHQLSIHLNQGDLRSILSSGEYGEAFTALEIFLSIARSEASRKFAEIYTEALNSFRLSGSVYSVNTNGEVYLVIDDQQVKNLEETKEILSENQTAYALFFNTVGEFISRRIKPSVLVNNLWIAYEDFLKELTGEKDFDAAIKKLQREGRILAVEKTVAEQLYRYRSSAAKVAHAGDEEEPGEIDAFWFLETLMAQIKVIKKKVGDVVQ